MVSWMCVIEVEKSFPSNELRERLVLDDTISVYSKTGCGGMSVCCEKKIMIG